MKMQVKKYDQFVETHAAKLFLLLLKKKIDKLLKPFIKNV